MSGIYLPGIEMPTSCFNCLFRSKIDPDTMFCDIRQAKFEEMFSHFERRDKACPLVPVPSHGRLIEDTAVREQIDEWLDSVGDVVVGRGLSYYGELLGCIEDAPTIIPAEEGEG